MSVPEPAQSFPSRELFRRVGLEPSNRAWSERLWITAADGGERGLPSGAEGVALFDGRLVPAHAELLRRAPPVSLLAKGDGELPGAWALRILDAVWSGASLVAGAGPEVIAVGQRAEVRRSGERVAEVAVAAGAGRATCELASDVAYELVANALLDAPADATGAVKYAHRRDAPELRIDAEDAATLRVSVDGGRMFLLAEDRFGRLRPESFARTIGGLAGRARVDQSGGGAGLGLRRIIEGSCMLAARVAPGRRSEVLAVVDLGENRRRAASPKSILFRIERG